MQSINRAVRESMSRIVITAAGPEARASFVPLALSGAAPLGLLWQTLAKEARSKSEHLEAVGKSALMAFMLMQTSGGGCTY